jgi:phage shock protein PspC (stress-responsive transcriptional regulator)
MKKIININLSGRVIPIEDSAYEKLQAYIESLRRYFAHEQGRDEIINDIESRIAELMNEKIRLGSSSITDEHVSEIIASMGTVADFEAAEKEETATGTKSGTQQTDNEETYSYTRKRSKRLYRDSGDKIIGGVCSGIANYLGINPTIIRILFAIITFGGFGLGFLAYIILWIVLPPRDLDEYTGKRLYRNPEDKVIGGVAGGLAAYYGKETWMIRLIFAAPIILNIFFGIFSWPFFHEGSFVPNIVFGSLSGTFIFIYIVLWIVLPEASSQYQKMEMRGEKVDVNSIRQNVKEGMDNMKDRVKDWSSEVRESAQNLGSKAKEFANTRGKTFAREAREAAHRTGGGIAHIIGVLFKAFFLFIAGTIAFGLFVAMLGLIFGGVGVWPVKDFFLDGFWQNAFAWGTLILFLGVPLVGFIVWLLRRIMKVRSHNNYLGWTFAGLWVLGWISVSCFVGSMVNDFRMSNYRTPPVEISITQPAQGKMIVTVNQPEILYSGTLPWINIDGTGVDITRDTFRLANVRIQIEQSKDDQYHVELKKYSRGNSVGQAEAKAQKMKFDMSYRDSVLDVGSGIAVDKETKFRGQKAIVIIYIPTGKKIRFDETVNKLHNIDFNIGDDSWDRKHRDFDYDTEYYFDYNVNVDYTMGADGLLKDPSGATMNRSNNYRDPSLYNDTLSTPGQPRQETKEEKIKRLQDLQKEIKNMDDTAQKKSSTFLENKTENNSEHSEFSGHGPSPVFSLVEW